MASSMDAARAVVAAGLAAGINHWIICPGSRSAPIALAVAQAEQHGTLIAHVRFDERSAGFAAVGMAKATAGPVAVVTTSGTAVANLLPAMMEAAHGGQAVIAVTADRPEPTRSSWANQCSATQPALLHSVCSATVDIDAASSTVHAVSDAFSELLAACMPTAATLPPARRRQPGHFNIQLSEPLVELPGAGAAASGNAESDAAEPQATAPSTAAGAVAPGQPGIASSEPAAAQAAINCERPTVVLAGDAAWAGALGWAAKHQLPVFCEPTAAVGGVTDAPGQHEGDLLVVTAYRNALRCSDLTGLIQQVVVFGRPTLSRPVAALLRQPTIDVIHVAADPDLPADVPVRRLRDVPVGNGCSPQWWTSLWQSISALGDQALGDQALSDLTSNAAEPNGVAIADHVSRHAVTAGRVVWTAASNAPRYLDLLPYRARPTIVGCRGLAGIDGTIAAAAGFAAVGHRVTVLIGDVAFAHDIASLAIAADPGAQLDLTIVVINDHGGGIFRTLEYPQATDQATFERFFATPPRVDFAAAAAAFGARYRLARTNEALAQALQDSVGVGVDVIEVPLDQQRNTEVLARWEADLTRQVAALVTSAKIVR